MQPNLLTKPIFLFSVLLSCLVWVAESLFHYFLFDHGHHFELIPDDQNELWMRIVICTIIIIFGGYIQRQSTKKKALEEEKLRTLKATMHTVEDRVGNTLLGIKFLLLDAQNSQIINLELSHEILKMIDDTINELREIRNLDVVREKRFSKDTYYLQTERRTAPDE
ncbi:MAG: hypothetical protein QNJ78_10855 [Gammaproteobacteria bacterium]|nr:hypothetical protein [Gammaproteobacteria bacterium]